MSDEIEIVERPVGRADVGRKRGAVLTAVLASAESGQAVRVPMNGKTQTQWSANLTSAVRYHGLKVRTRRDGDHIILWAEKKD